MLARREKDLLAKKTKYRDNPEEKKQAVKKSESIRQYGKVKYLMNQISRLTYQKAKYQENPEVQLAYKKCQYLEIAEMKKDYQKMKYQSNPEIKKQYKKRYQENPELHKKIKTSGIRNHKKRKIIVRRLRIFFNK